MPWLDSVKAIIHCDPGGRVLEVQGPSCNSVLVASCHLLCETSPSTFDTLPTSDQIHFNPPENSNLTPSNSLSFSLPVEFEAWKYVFSPQKYVFPPHIPCDCEIILKLGSTAPVSGTYTLTPDETEELCSYIDEQLSNGLYLLNHLLKHQLSLWKSLAREKRPCVDYQGLNKGTIFYSYSIPAIVWLLNQLSNSKYFAKIDLKSAFNLIQVAKGDGWLTAFQTPWGLFEYKLMPLGLANAPAIFQCFIRWSTSDYYVFDSWFPFTTTGFLRVLGSRARFFRT